MSSATPVTYENREISVDSIFASAENPRVNFDAAKMAELAESLNRRGLIEPIVVRPRKAGGFEIVAGERRWRAAKVLAWKMISCRVASADLSDLDAQINAVSENVDRDDLTTFELARAAYGLKTKYSLKGPEIAKIIRRAPSYANMLIRCFNGLSPKIMKAWQAGHGLATMDELTSLSTISDTAEQDEQWDMICTEQDAETAASGPPPSPEDGRADKKVRLKASVANAIELESAFRALKKAKQYDDREKFAHDCVLYILGKRKSPPVTAPEENSGE